MIRENLFASFESLSSGMFRDFHSRFIEMKFKVFTLVLTLFIFGCSEPEVVKSIDSLTYTTYCLKDSIYPYEDRCEGRKVSFEVYYQSGEYKGDSLTVSLKDPNSSGGSGERVDLNVESWLDNNSRGGGYRDLKYGDALFISGVVGEQGGTFSRNEIDDVTVINVVGKRKPSPEEYIAQNIKDGQKALEEWDQTLANHADETRKEYAAKAVSHKMDVSVPGVRIDHYKLTSGKYATCTTKTNGPGGPIIDCVESW